MGRGFRVDLPGWVFCHTRLSQISDTGAIETVIQNVLAGNPKEVESYRGGKTKLMGFFVGEVMKATRGQANPKAVNELLRKLLGS